MGARRACLGLLHVLTPTEVELAAGLTTLPVQVFEVDVREFKLEVVEQVSPNVLEWLQCRGCV